MGFRFRRSLKLLPGMRLNLSGRGASVSFGVRGLRYTLGKKGSRVTVGIPGSGLSWSEYTPYQKAPAGQNSPRPVEPMDGSGEVLNPIQSGPIDQINSASTSEIAPILNAAHCRTRLAPFVILISAVVFGASCLTDSQILIRISAAYAALAIIASVFLDRYRRSVRLEYEFPSLSQKISDAIQQTFSDIRSCSAVWRIEAAGATSDWKRHGGATELSKRRRISPSFKRPACIRGGVTFASIPLGPDTLFFLPDAALLVRRNLVAALHYKDVDVTLRRQRFIEEERVPRDSEVVDQTWRYVNKRGGPDRRFSGNKQIPVCIYGELNFASASGLDARIHLSNPTGAQRFVELLEIFKSRLPSGVEGIVKSAHVAQRWPTVAFGVVFLMLGSAIVWQARPSIIVAVEQAKEVDTRSKSPNGATVADQPTVDSILPTNAAANNRVPLPRPRPAASLVMEEAPQDDPALQRKEYFTPD